MKDLVNITRYYSAVIQNGRSIEDAFDHAEGEMAELKAEIEKRRNGEPPGPDGIRGEAIDAALCLIDIIFLDDPETKDAAINLIAKAKCEKWANKYGGVPSTEQSRG